MAFAYLPERIMAIMRELEKDTLLPILASSLSRPPSPDSPATPSPLSSPSPNVSPSSCKISPLSPMFNLKRSSVHSPDRDGCSPRRRRLCSASSSSSSSLPQHSPLPTISLGSPACNEHAPSSHHILPLSVRLDPFSSLPSDIALLILELFDVFSLARLREVSRKWRKLGDASLAAAKWVEMAKFDHHGFTCQHWPALERDRQRASDNGEQPYAVRLLALHCRSLQYIALWLGPGAYGERDLSTVLMATAHLRALKLECDVKHDHAVRISEQMCASFRMCCHWLRVLSLRFAVLDEHAGELTKSLPNLEALQIKLFIDPARTTEPLLTSAGLADLLTHARTLRVLSLGEAAHLCDPIPHTRAPTTLRRIALHNCMLSGAALHSLCAHLGSQLVTLSLSNNKLVKDDGVIAVAERCVHMRQLCLFGTPVSSACLSAIATLTELRHVRFSQDRFTRAAMATLRRQSASPHIDVCVSYLLGLDIFGFSAMVKNEGIAVERCPDI